MIANILDIFNMIAAKQNQKFPFHFLSAPPTPPAEENKKGKENFWFLPPRPKGADEACRLERTIQFQATTRSAREISSFRQGSARNAVELCSIHTAKVIFEIKYCPVRLRIKLRRDAQFHKWNWRAVSSVGRASPWRGEGQRFKSSIAHIPA